MRLLVTGAHGQLGLDVVAAFDDHEVVAAGHVDLDLADRDSVMSVVTSVGPEVIVNCAAWTEVDACESDPDRAFAVNGLGVRHLVDAGEAAGSRICHVSTDYVFDGEKREPYHEWDIPNPKSVYGASKLAGENELRPGDTVVRTSWLSGAGGANMVKTVLRLMGEHAELRFVDDQVGHPSFTPDIASVIHRLVVDRRSGLFHATNQGAVSWYEFAREVLLAAGEDPERVTAIGTGDMPRPAPRPANSVLENRAMRLSGLPLAPDFRESLAALVAELQGT